MREYFSIFGINFNSLVDDFEVSTNPKLLYLSVMELKITALYKTNDHHNFKTIERILDYLKPIIIGNFDEKQIITQEFLDVNKIEFSSFYETNLNKYLDKVEWDWNITKRIITFLLPQLLSNNWELMSRDMLWFKRGNEY